MSSPACPLCGDADTRRFAAAFGQQYFDCAACRLIFLDPVGLPNRDAERAHYLTHENNPEDPGYRQFLDRLALPLCARLKPGAQGLDYGSGPGPTLSLILSERGFPTLDYDPFFARFPERLERQYDFITSTEVVEHCHHPGQQFEQLSRLLKPQGVLAVMTEVLRDESRFATWHYLRDPTHVCFYRPEALAWVAQHWGWSIEWAHPNVALFRTP